MPSYARIAIYPAYKRPGPNGYRKTLRVVRRRRRSHEMPPWRARFVLDAHALMCPGRVDLAGATIKLIGRCVVGEVVGADREWVLRQIEALAAKLGHDHRPLMVRITRSAQPALTIAAPFARGDDGVIALGHAQVVEGNAMRAMLR